MIYDEPVFRLLGDCYLAVEFGDEPALALSVRVLSLAQQLDALRLPGIVEIQPSPRELAIVIDRARASHQRVEAAVHDALSAPLVEKLISRVVTLPTWYDDPWSAATAARFAVPQNLQFVAEHNNMSPAQVIERHSAAVHWNTAVGFTPGCNWYYPIDASLSLSAPTYDTPRSFTPTRAVGLLGRGTSTYPVESPGGIQLIGRIAVEIYDPAAAGRGFDADGVLLRAGDRIVHRSIGALEYDEIRAAIATDTYEYEIEDGEVNVKELLPHELLAQPRVA